MINIEHQRRLGIKQAKKSIANIYKKRKGSKLTDGDRAEIARQQVVLDRWERTSSNGVKL